MRRPHTILLPTKMPILIALLVLAALVAGAIYVFDAIAQRFGEPVAITAAVLAAIVLIALVAWWLQRRREIAPNTREDGWTHLLRGTWGEMRLSTTRGLLWLTQDGVEDRHTLSDLQGTTVDSDGSHWFLVIRLDRAQRAEWRLPMQNRRDALRWARVLTLAQAHRL